ncbi:MAG TPA: PAAR domain-containing protein [Pyrinomonadaceae bacterium]|nr:PAAR domain-containing protein [Pyrinomonadaceae bacterium]
MIKLNEALKFAKEQTKRNADTKAAQGAGLPKKQSSKRASIPPEAGKILASSALPLLTKGMASLLSKGNFKGLGDMVSLDGLIGMAAQFLPPWAGDGLAVGKALASGNLAGAADALLSKYLPPEVKAVYDAIKNLPGGWKEFLKWLTDKPKEPQGANGLWAARISDLVVCPGGAGMIDSGLPTVIIGGMPAARVTDTAICNGVPKADKIMLGESTIIFGGHFASRITDKTAHGGTITTGFPTVHLSKSPGQCESCLTVASSGGASAGQAGAGAGAGGAATISGAGITNPFVADKGLLGDLASGVGDKLKDMAINKITELAKDKIGDLIKSDKTEVKNEENQKTRKQSPKSIEEMAKTQPHLSFDDDD